MENDGNTALLEPKIAHLRASGAFSGAEVSVDSTAGIIKNAAVMTAGQAKGHGFTLDSTSLQQLADLINAAPDGILMRFKHPTMNSDGSTPDTLGTDVGRLKNARIVGDAVRGDVHLGEWAKALPGIGDAWSYLLTKAARDPTGFGLSAVIGFQIEPVSNPSGISALVARISQLDAVDFVGKPAANPNGLLSSTNPPASAGGILSTPNKGGSTMEPTTISPPAQTPAPEAPAPVVAPVQTATLNATSVTTLDTIEAETKRVTQIKALGAVYPGLPDSVVQLAIANDMNPAQARTAFLQAIAKANPPIKDVKVGDDQSHTAMLAAMSQGIMLRAGVKVENPHELARKYQHNSLIDNFRTHLITLGVPANEVMSIPRMQLVDWIMRPHQMFAQLPGYAQLAQSTSSFANITLDAMGKTLRKAYMDTPTTWQMWCSRDTASDFKAKKFISLSDAPGLTVKAEGNPITYSTLSDGKESATLATYASGIILTREAVINDDLGAFGRIPMSQGGAAKRLEDDVAYAILTANAALSDSAALFLSATHANLVVATAALGAPTVATVAATEKLMLLQTGPKGSYLKPIPKFLIVPVALKTTAQQLVNSTVDPSKSNATINPYNGSLTVIADPRLDAASSTVWYLAADPAVIDTVTVVFFTDEPEPTLKQETVFDTEDVKFAVKHNVVAKAVDYRGMVKNPGA